MTVASFVKPFYTPISAGGMAHTGAVPQGNISYHVITPVGNGYHNIRTTTPLPARPIMAPKGYMPVSLQPVQVPRPSSPLGPNMVNPHNT